MAHVENVKEKRSSKARKRVVHRRLRILAYKMYAFIRYYLDLFIDKIFGLYYNSRVQHLKSAQNPIVLESASYLATKIRKRQFTCEQVVKAFVEQARDVNKLLNAIVHDRFDDAIKEAQNIDKDIANGTIIDVDFQTKPFLGIPFTVKESTAAKGMSHTFGLVCRKGRKASADAYCVEKMKEAGGILIGVTNIPQLNLWQESGNPIFGTTNNPYNSTRNVGGSSGGEASILAGCGSAIGIGSDIGGSLRIPAYMCGVYGHKPSSHIISTRGLTFRTGEEKETMVVAGPMTKYAEDIPLLLKVLAGPNVDKLKLNQPVSVRELKVHYVSNPRDPFVSPSREEMTKLTNKVVNHFTQLQGQKPQELKYDEFKVGGKLWRYWMTQEPNANFKRDVTDRKGEIGIFIEVWKYIIGKGEFGLPVIFYLLSSLLPKVKEDWARQQTKNLEAKLLSVLGKDGVLIYPSAPWPASYHHTALLRPWNFNLFAIWNALQFPVTQVPLGLSKDGLPLGIQVVAAPYQDHLCIAVAKELEHAFGGYVAPFKVEK